MSLVTNDILYLYSSKNQTMKSSDLKKNIILVLQRNITSLHTDVLFLHIDVKFLKRAVIFLHTGVALSNSYIDMPHFCNVISHSSIQNYSYSYHAISHSYVQMSHSYIHIRLRLYYTCHILS